MTNQTTDTGIPEFLKRTDQRGVSLSAGPAPKAVTVTAAKTDKPVKEPKAPKQPRTTLAKEVKAPKAAKAAKEAKPPKAAKEAKPPKAAKEAKAPVIDPATGQPVEKVVRSIVPSKFKERYAKHNGTCGDDMAKELKAATTMLNADKRETLDVEALWAIAKQNGIDVSKYIDLNNGQKRMNIGNKLRGLLKAGTDVVIGTGKTKRVFKAEDLKV